MIRVRYLWRRICSRLALFDCRTILNHDCRDDARRTTCLECGWFYKWK